MNSNPPPPARRIEIVPLDDQHAPGRPLPPSAAAPEALRPLPAWPPPAVRTTLHPAAGTTLPHDVVIDLTSLVPATEVVNVDLTDEPAPVAVAVAGARAVEADPSVIDVRRARLRALLDAERAELERHAPVLHLRPQVLPDVAPFPIPGPSGRIVRPDAPPQATDPAATAVGRRVPKAVRPDAEARPLSGDVAAAIHRLTGRQLPPPPPPPVARRIEIVPLGDAPVPDAPLAPVVHLNPPRPAEQAETAAPAEIDLRDGAHLCPACQTPGRPDVIDHIAHTVHLTCSACFRMWTEPLPAGD